MTEERGCAVCGTHDGDIDVGWSLCGDCFHGDRFDGVAYWTQVGCLLVLLVALSFLLAAVRELGAGL